VLTFSFSVKLAPNKFLACKATERGEHKASLSEASAADGNSGELFDEI